MKEAAFSYERARNELSKSEAQRSDYARATANLGFILLHLVSEEAQSQALALIEESSDIKAETGDIQGLASNYNHLGRHYHAV